jgi:gliding motility-associated-like protein
MLFMVHTRTISASQLFLPVIFFLVAISSGFGQALNITGANTGIFTPQSLIQNVFLGEGVEVTNITFNGDPVAIGYFAGGQAAVGIERGILLTTGRAQSGNMGLGGEEVGQDFASNSNLGGSVEPNLAPLVSNPLNDVASYTISFIPTSDTLRFRYCFASEEYPEYSCSQYNDIFGFFIQGPGYPTATNIALIPNTNLPVSINNIHPTFVTFPPCPSMNGQFYINNNNTSLQPVYDGRTRVFIAQAIVTPCQVYTITLAIADVGDTAFDSGVFLEAKSFGTGAIRTEVATFGLDGTVSEGCANGSVTFELASPAVTNFPLDYTIFGTATNGVDYKPIPLDLFIPAGQSKVVMEIEAFEDLIPEGIETIFIDYKKDPCKRDTVQLNIRERILVDALLPPDTALCAGTLLGLDGTLNMLLPPPITVSNTQSVQIAPFNTAVSSSIMVSGILQTTLDTGIIKSICINVDHNWIDDLDIFLVTPNGQFMELTTDNGGNGDDYTNTCFAPSATIPINFPGPFAPSSAAPFTGTFKPEGVWSDLWGGPTNGEWKLQLVDDQNGIVGTLLNWSIVFEPGYKISYDWAPSVGLTCSTCPATDATPLQTTQYTMVATDSYGCSTTDSVEIIVNPVLAAATVSCGNSTSSSVTFIWPNIPDATGYEINVEGMGWVSIQSDTFYTVSGLAPSSVIDAEIRGFNSQFSCGANIALGTCVNCSPPLVAASTTPVTCFNGNNGSVSVTTDNINPPYSFRVGTSSNNTGDFNGLTAGNYICTITDALGCDTLLDFTIGTPPELLTNIIVQQSISCFGGSNGTVLATATGGSGGFTYLWSVNNTTTPSLTGLSVGNYAVTVTDMAGCSITTPVILTQPPVLAATSTALSAKCNGTPTGTLNGNGAGGTAPYSFVWSNGQIGQTVPNVLSGAYILSVTDSKGCVDTSQVIVGQPAVLSVTLTNTPATCNDKSDGTATAAPLGGTSPYVYAWSGGVTQTGISVNNLLPAIYTVTATDANQCTATAITAITAPTPLQLSTTITDVSCNLGSNGSILVTATGANGGYTYTWSAQGQNQPVATGLITGNYTATVTDSKGCTKSIVGFVNQPEALLPTMTTVNAKCFGAPDGQAKVSMVGGVQPYTYLWSSGQTTLSAENIPGGIYTVTTTDAKGCTVTASVTVGQQPQIVPLFTPINILCYNGLSGSINAAATGGTPPFSYKWFGPDNFISLSNFIDSVGAGAYSLTITDANSCTRVDTVTLFQPASPLQLELPYVSDTVCFNTATGTAKVFAQGGITPYSFVWDDSLAQNTQFALDLPVNTYRVTVTDANGCTQSDSTFIYQKNPLFVYVTPYLPRCFEGSDGYASVDFVSFGADPYDPNLINFVWNTTPPQTGRLATGLQYSTVYTVSATDEDGCVATQVAPIGNQEELTGYFTSVENIKCFGESTGTAVINGAGGTAPFTYFWSPNMGSQTDPFGKDMRAETYYVTITDDRICQTVTSITLTEPAQLENVLTPNRIPCFGELLGTIESAPNGGIFPYSFEWSNGTTDDGLANVPTGGYKITLTDKNGCTRVDSTFIDQPDSPVGGTSVPTDVTCFGGNNGRLLITADGGVPPYAYALDNAPFNGSPVQIALAAGSYLPRVRDANGCIVTLPAVTVGQPQAIEVDLGPDIRLELGKNIQLTLDAINANPPIRITWEAADSTWLSCLDCDNPIVDSLFQDNTFEVLVVDALGCRGENSINVVIEKPRKIYVATGFTPNGDGVNDIMFVQGQESAFIKSFRVYDRWGEMVFRSFDFRPNDINLGWNGMFRDQPMLQEVYVWVIEVEYLDGYREVLHGQTTLIR